MRSTSSQKEINMNRFEGTFCARSDRGLVRPHNEDCAKITLNAAGDVLLVVADGIGGYKRGEIASKIAVDTLCDTFSKIEKFRSINSAKSFLTKQIRHANKIIFGESLQTEGEEKMGTTLVAALIRCNKMVICNIGDSRALMLKDDELIQLTQDHTYVEYLVRTEQISKEEALKHPLRHVIINALGNTPSVNLDIKIHNYNGETILLCSDGLYHLVNNKEIQAILATTDNVEQKTEMLIALANNKGGTDNIAVALWESDDD
jgi:serine/threonine protein phosphatase PrpC